MTAEWETLGIAPQVSSRRESRGPTPSQTVGPYFEIGLSWMGPESAQLVKSDLSGAVILTGQVFDGAGDPVSDAVVEIWQADGEGQVGGRNGFAGWGRDLVDESGTFRFTTIRPGPIDRNVAPYIAVNVFARGVLQRLATRIYLPGHPANDTDPLLASLKPERRATLIAETCGDELHHDFRLQGDRETVFLVW